MALAQKKFEYLKNAKNISSESTQTYIEDGFSVTEKVIKLQKYESSNNEGSKKVIPEQNFINIRFEKVGKGNKLYASNNDDSISYNVKKNKKVKIFYTKNGVVFENNGNGPSIGVDVDSDVKINIVNDTGNNFEVSFQNQNYIKNSNEIYIYYTGSSDIKFKKNSEGITDSIIEHNDSSGDGGVSNSFIMYKVSVNVSKDGKTYQMFEGYKPIFK